MTAPGSPRVQWIAAFQTIKLRLVRISAAHAARFSPRFVGGTLPRLGAAFMRTVADQFADILVAAGVKRIYGIVGDSDGRCSVVIIADAGVRP
jgi:hypothetical protein